MATIGNNRDIGLGAFVTFGPDTFCFQTVDGPNSEISDDIEVTNSCSAQKEYIPGIIDGSTITMTFNMDTNRPQKPSRELKVLQIHFPFLPGPVPGLRPRYRALAYIKSAPASIPIGDVITQTITFKISGTEEWFDRNGQLVP